MFVVVGVLGVLVASVSGTEFDESSPVVTQVGTVLQALVLIGTAILFARRIMTPRLWHFGLRGTRFWPAVGWSALGLLGFYVFAAIYVGLVRPEGEQNVVEDLGADQGVPLLLAGAVVVVVVAPIAEEFFFRGFFYKALRSRFSIVVAALIDGVVFGLIHVSNSETLLLAPVLAVLGFVFCVVYERTGSLYPPITLHALNNAIAYSLQPDLPDWSWLAAVPLALAVFAGCALAPRLLDSHRVILR
jgi:membrane protease YdiL (CAAX protease family)